MISLQPLNNIPLFPLHKHHSHFSTNTTNKIQLSRPFSLQANHSTHHLSHITHLCEACSLNQALLLLQSSLNDATFTSFQTKKAIGILLQACALQKDIEIGTKTHHLVKNSYLYCDDFVLNTRLITMYAMCGSILDSRLLFDNLPRKNLVQWNAMVSGYTRHELYRDAIDLFVELIMYAEFKPDNFTFPCVIKACGWLLNAGLGKVIHGTVIKMGLVLDVFVANALIAMYGKCGFIDEAIKMFDNMPVRNLVSWNSMICGFSGNGLSQECFGVLVDMLVGEEGFLPDNATMVKVLPVCAREVNGDMGMGIHSLAVKLGLCEEVMVNNSLVDMYSKCGYLNEAQVLFDRNNSKNAVSWNAMIGGFSKARYVSEAFGLLRNMQMQVEIEIDHVTMLNILPTFFHKSQLLSLKELHGYSIRHGFQSDELVGNAFVAAYAKCGMLSSAEHVFHSVERKTVNSWNAIIGGYAQNGDPKRALDLYIKMTCSDLEPDSYTIGILLLACARLKSLPSGKEVHGFLLRNRLESDAFIGISLLSFYIHCGKSSSARVLFDGLEDKSIVSWNAMISGYSQNGLPNEALNLFCKLLCNRIQPCETTIASVFRSCSQLSALRLGKETHCYALKNDFIEDVYVRCSVIDMYGKSGCIKESESFFNGLRDKDVASWNSMIAAYGVHGQGEEAIDVFKKMKEVGHIPDSFTFIGIFTACNHAGLVEEGLKYFNEMQNSHGIEPQLEHYGCLVDMLGRAGRLEDASRLANEMLEQPDSGIWGSLLSSCRIYGDVEMGKKVAEKLLESEPKKVENYVLLSNLYAGSGRWGDVRRVRQMMKDINLQKDAGCSWIEVGGKVYNFIVGENMHAESEEMRITWRRLEKKISKIGYKPQTSCVLHELEEEEKIDILRGHSEKLAISFGLLKTRKGTTLRIFKNLRVCVDCHNAAKLVSKVVEREIIMRDNKRFHHFRNGVCSCRDHW